MHWTKTIARYPTALFIGAIVLTAAGQSAPASQSTSTVSSSPESSERDWWKNCSPL